VIAEIAVSVVIGFKDWGAERLVASIRSIRAAIEPLSGEVVVSDYGSAEGPVVRDAVEREGARYVYTPTNGRWSRSRALNAGFASARGSVLISTDADMIFSPGALAAVAREVLRTPNTAVVLQCRDLPEGYSHAAFLDGEIDWDTVEAVSRIRPRWGMGGMMAVRREAYARVHGFDERMEIYGGEDIDFANRIRRAGVRLHWMERRDVRMYHMWHAPTRTSVTATPEGRAAVEFNRSVMLEDRTIVRNRGRWIHPLVDHEPLVSVVIATHNRAAYLADSINSVLAQTFQDFELIVVDDGSTDGTRAAVEAFDDPRIRYLHQERAGVAAARNHAARESRGVYTAVHDDDDLMLPWRLEAGLSSVETGLQGSYGGWVDFDDVTGAMTANDGRSPFSVATLLYSSKVYAHATLLIETAVLRAVGYEESMRSGSDYNLAVRLARSGVRLAHTGEYHIMRRIHPDQMTESNPLVQGSSARSTVHFAQGSWSEDQVRALRQEARASAPATPRHHDDLTALRRYLPDRLAHRSVVVDGPSDVLRGLGAEPLVVVTRSDDAGERVWAVVPDATLGHLARMVVAGLRPTVLDTQHVADPFEMAVASVLDGLSVEKPGWGWVVDRSGANGASGGAAPRLTVRLHSRTSAPSVWILGFSDLAGAASVLVGRQGRASILLDGDVAFSAELVSALEKGVQA
jgi:glycosyltransferase involved in cell wall biosynthesis